MTVTITAQTADIYQAVYHTTGRTGLLSGDTDRLSATEDDTAVLGKYLADALAGMESIRSLTSASLADDGTVTLTFGLPSNWDTGLTSALRSAVSSHLANSVTMRWYGSGEAAQTHGKLAQDALAVVLRIVCKRKKPTR